MGKQQRVLIGVPSYFSVDPNFHVSMLQTFGWLSVQGVVPNPAVTGKLVHSFGDSPHVGRSRDNITAEFLAGDYTDLLFIDSDIIFSVENVKRILSHDLDVVGGLYFKKQEGQPEPVINAMKEPEIRDDNLIQVAYIGTGFLRIRRNVFESMITKYGDDIWYNVDGLTNVKQYNFWNLGIYRYPDGSRRWLSEDWWFCQRCAELGIKVWADRQIPLRHSGNAVYPLSYQENTIFGKDASEPMTVAGGVAPLSEPATV